MDHQKYQDWLLLQLCDELSKATQQELEAHLHVCTECQTVLEDLQKLHAVLGQYAPMVLGEEDIEQARKRLHGSLQKAGSSSALQRLGGSLRGLLTGRTYLFPGYKIALAAASTVAIGLFLGYLLFSSRSLQHDERIVSSLGVADTVQVSRDVSRISNVRFLQSDLRNGQVEFTFDAVMPVHVKGSVNDPEVQKVLAHALVNEQNPGVRLRSVSAIGSSGGGDTEGDVKDALVAAAKFDENPGVRMQALRVLRRFHFDIDVKRAFLYVLTHDTTSGLRIEAINGLVAERDAGSPVDQEMLDVFKERLVSDNNSYIRLRSKTILEGKK